MVVPVVDGGFCGPDGFGDGQFGTGWAGRDDRQSGPQRAVIEPGIEDGGAQSFAGDAVAAGFWEARDEPVQAQPAQVVGHPSRGHLARLLSEQRSKSLA